MATTLPNTPQLGAFTLVGAGVTALTAFAFAWLIHTTRGNRSSASELGRMIILLAILVLFVIIFSAYMRRHWLQHLRQQSLTEVSGLIARAQSFDSAGTGALTLIQEVELVSRGYRMYVLRHMPYNC